MSETLLSYQFATDPAPIQASTIQRHSTCILNLAVLPGQSTAYCGQIMIAIPVGANAESLSEATPSSAVNTAKWEILTLERKPGRLLGLAGDTEYAVYTFRCRDAGDYQINYPLTFGFKAETNLFTGEFTVLLREHAGTSPDPGSFTERESQLSLDKVAPQFYLQNFMATAIDRPTVPATEFANGADIRFSWESNGTYFQLYKKNEPQPFYAGMESSFTLKGGLHSDATIVLVASVASGPASGKEGAGFQPVYLFDAISLTVSNPDLTPQSLKMLGEAALQNTVVSGALSVSGATQLAAATMSGPVQAQDLNVAGKLTANGEVQVGNGLKVGGTGTFGSLEVGGRATISNGAQINGGVTMGGNVTLSGGASLLGALTATSGTIGMLGGVQWLSAGSWTATSDGFVIGTVSSPGEVSKECFGRASGSSDGVRLTAIGGNTCSFVWQSGLQWGWTMAPMENSFILPVRKDRGFYLSTYQYDKNQVNAVFSFAYIPLGAGTAKKLTAEVPEGLMHEPEVQVVQVQNRAEDLVKALEEILGETIGERQRALLASALGLPEEE